MQASCSSRQGCVATHRGAARASQPRPACFSIASTPCPLAAVAHAQRPAASPALLLPSTSTPWRHDRHQQHCRAPMRRPVRCASAQGEGAPHPFPEEEDFDLLADKIAGLTKELEDELCGCSIYIVGMMGSGKSTVGRMLANTLKYAFFDTDTMVEMAHDKKAVAQIFKEYGEPYFRDCEGEVLKQLAPYKNLVVATGGGAVVRPMNWSYLHSGVVVWLNGPIDLLARRVAAEGITKRPLLAPADGAELSQEELTAAASKKLTGLLEDRAKFYETADLKISLEGYGMDAEKGAPVVVVMYRLLCALKQKIKDTKREREEKQQFTIERGGDVPSMRTQQSPAQKQDEQQEQ